MIKAIVTDIEGTTTSISFVADILFPYAKQRMAHFLEQHQAQAEVAREIEACRVMAKEPDATLTRVTEILVQWIEQDVKATPLKTLQGMIWRHGYEDGSLKGHLYPEVADKLKQWHASGIDLSVYSSGSEAAQKLLFGYSVAGDLSPLFNRYFDTRIGGKKETASYQTIQSQLSYPANEILFMSDVVDELDAAQQAGLVTIALDRLQVAEGFGCHPVVTSFSEIDLESLG